MVTIEITKDELAKIKEMMTQKYKYMQKSSETGELFDRFATEYHAKNKVMSLCVMPYLHDVCIQLEECERKDDGLYVTTSIDLTLDELMSGKAIVPCYDENDNYYEVEVQIVVEESHPVRTVA